VEQEGKIAFFDAHQCHQLLLHTNGIQAYKVNWPGYARPDGELDQRILDWAGNLWRKRLRQEERLDLARQAGMTKKQRDKATEEFIQSQREEFPDVAEEVAQERIEEPAEQISDQEVIKQAEEIWHLITSPLEAVDRQHLAKAVIKMLYKTYPRLRDDEGIE
jgi:hypothetical protein